MDEEIREEIRNEDAAESEIAAGTETADAEAAGDGQRLEFLRRDAARFQERYPDVDLCELEKGAAFRRFCGSRLYVEPVAELYEDFLAITREAETAADARLRDRQRRSTGAGSGSVAGGLSAAEQRELDAWNAAFPQMRMTAREFQSR